MALINCPECGKKISDKAASCPDCGCPAREWGFAGTSLPNVGDIIIFGSYPQTRNGETAPIEWIVLDKRGRIALLISKYALDANPYVEDNNKLRKWLNNDFFYAAFNTQEQSRIVQTTATAEINQKYSTNSGNNTIDKVFLLSDDETKKYFTNDGVETCVPTEYAMAQGASANDEFNLIAISALLGGLSDADLYRLCHHAIHKAVRPAMWISLE